MKNSILLKDISEALPDLLTSLQVSKLSRPDGAGRETGSLRVEVVTPIRRTPHLLHIDVQASATPSRVRESLRHLKARLPGGAAGYPVLASRFLSTRVREICREEGTGYLDLAGNCLLHFDEFHLEKRVDRNPFPVRGRPPALFGPVASRVARALLEDRHREWTVSELASVCGVSLGHVSNVTRRLRDEAYLDRRQRRLHLIEPAKLLEAWRDEGPSSAEVRRAYYSFELGMGERLAKLSAIAAARGWRYAVTSFAAASLVAPFVQGIETLEWYVEDAAAISGWVEAMGLRPVQAGPNVMLRAPSDPGVFHRTQAINGVTIVGPVQLYLDLWSEPSRGREQAEFLRQQMLDF
jgi:hypothetical protein